MIDLTTADHVEIRLDETGKLWVNIDEQCAVRVGKVATLQLETYDPESKLILHEEIKIQ